MRQYICEGVTGAFPYLVDRSKPLVTESRPSGITVTRIPGRFSICDCVNGNNRRYRKQVWESNLKEGSTLMNAIANNAAFGLLEHPKDGIVTLESPISHQVTAAKLVESRDAAGHLVHEVVGEIALYDTPEGNKLKALIEGGYNPMVSSRGYGSVEKAPDGVDEVQDDFVCESWDVVIKPSFATAILTPPREDIAPSTQARMAAPAVESLSESQPDSSSAPTTPLKESPSKPGPAGADAGNRTNIMELNEIQSRIALLQGLDPTKLDPARFSESLTEAENLHQHVAEFAAADPKRSYAAHRLHSTLESVTKRFSEAATAPRKTAAKLQEHNTKLMRVINAVAQTGLTYKKRLGESLSKANKLGKINEELVRRGQGWRKIAEDRKSENAQTTKKFTTACEALDLMAARYHADTTELARRVLQLEFQEQLTAKPALAKRLKEATRLRHVANIREELEGKGLEKPAEGKAPGKEAIKDDDQDGAPSPNEGCVAPAPGKVTNESKAPKAKAPTPAAAPRQEHKISLTPVGDPRGLNESVEMVRRLSGAAVS